MTVTDQLSVKRPSLCSTEGPSLRPDLPTQRRCGERRSRKDGRRPPFFTARSVLEGRSPQRHTGGEVRTPADSCVSGTSPKPKAAIRDNTHKWRGCPRGLWLSTAQLRPICPRRSGCWRAPTTPPPAQNSTHRKKTASTISLNAYHGESSIERRATAHLTPLRHHRLRGWVHFIEHSWVNSHER